MNAILDAANVNFYTILKGIENAMREKDMFEKNTKQVNRIIARMFIVCTALIIFLVICSYFGVFEFGYRYTMIMLIAGLGITISPSILIRFLPDNVMKYYMLIALSVFIGILGTNNHIGIYITYVLVPVFSCLYFDPGLTARIGAFSYVVMGIAVYINSAGKYEVVYQGRPRMQMYIAYMLGFTAEYIVIGMILYFLVNRAKRMMEERYSAEEQNRMKSRFLSSMSHEIRTPMNAILGMAEVALRKDMPEDVRKCLDVIRSSSAGLLEIINDILDISKIEAGKLSIIEETYTTESLIVDMQAVIDARNVDKKIPIIYHIPEHMPYALLGDAGRIKQVMFNYASNAIKYTDQGQIDITLSCKDRGDGMVDLTYSVADTGQGIRPEDMDKLFTMYGQLDMEKNYGKEGTGIGLAISKGFVDLMHGTVGVESVYGKGSRFSFTIPQKKIEESKGKEEQKESFDVVTQPEHLFWAEGVRILLVDDNEINREVVKEILDPLQLQIDEAKNGKEAVERAGDTAYDLILMDSQMPVMTGEEATVAIRSDADCINRQVPVIALTADAVSGVRERLLGSGMNDYIVKPIDVKQMYDLLYRYLPKEKIRR